VQVARAAERRSSAPLERQGLAVLWAPKCEPAAQTVHLERRVFFAGPEYKLGAALSLFRGRGAGFVSARLLVNGRELLKAGPRDASFERTDARPKVSASA
jgi:hypothetical protein